MEADKKPESSRIDYKDIIKLGALVNPHARILSRKRTGFRASDQRDLAKSIKRARFMALLPYVSH